MIAQQELKRLFQYDPETGYFIRLISTSPRVKIGDIAGSIGINGYRYININRKMYLAHRLVFLYVLGAYPESQADHINHVRDDNRWQNLREVGQIENSRNSGISKNNKTGITGVSWDKRLSKFHAKIMINRKGVHLGYFQNFLEACCSRKSAEKQYGFHKNHGSML